MEFESDFDDKVKALEPGLSGTDVLELRSLITDVLERDPRPLIYKETSGPLEQDEHALYLADWNLHFRFKNQSVLVTKIEKT